MKFQDFWIEAARGLFRQAVAGAPELAELPDNAARAARLLADGGPAYAAALGGELAGSFTVLLDPALVQTPLLGEGVDQKAAWGELLREIVGAAAGELAAQTGAKCRIEHFAELGSKEDSNPAAAIEASGVSRAFELRSGGRVWQVAVVDAVVDAVLDEVRALSARSGLGEGETPRTATEALGAERDTNRNTAREAGRDPDLRFNPSLDQNLDRTPGQEPAPGFDLLLDVELEASLRFGSKEMSLAEILELGPGDMVQLDRHVADPVDLVVGDKIVARGEVVLVNGNFGLRVTEVAAPRKRLESIRCLF